MQAGNKYLLQKLFSPDLLALDQAFLLNLQLAEPNSITGWMMVFNILNIKMELGGSGLKTRDLLENLVNGCWKGASCLTE